MGKVAASYGDYFDGCRRKRRQCASALFTDFCRVRVRESRRESENRDWCFAAEYVRLTKSIPRESPSKLDGSVRFFRRALFRSSLLPYCRSCSPNIETSEKAPGNCSGSNGHLDSRISAANFSRALAVESCCKQRCTGNHEAAFLGTSLPKDRLVFRQRVMLDPNAGGCRSSDRAACTWQTTMGSAAHNQN
jgi:hypothetical protein